MAVGILRGGGADIDFIGIERGPRILSNVAGKKKKKKRRDLVRLAERWRRERKTTFLFSFNLIGVRTRVLSNAGLV